MGSTEKFYSGKKDAEIEATVVERRKTRVLLRLPDGNVIFKKYSQLLTNKTN